MVIILSLGVWAPLLLVIGLVTDKADLLPIAGLVSWLGASLLVAKRVHQMSDRRLPARSELAGSRLMTR